MDEPKRDRSDLVRELFEAACALDPARWRSYLAEMAGPDPGLQQEVLALLEKRAVEGDPLLAAAPAPAKKAPAFPPAVLPLHPDRLGPYRILDVIGEGGMGIVYLGEQREPVHRRVAVKVMKYGMDTRAVLARFSAERQALSLMEHSCIARIHDAGTSPQGLPWFAMEYVKGVPITNYCDDQHLSVCERLELFRLVCAGVGHAHLKGVIHRDIKPSNVLVTLQDGLPRPKIVDFGLAKAMDHRLVETTIFTQRGQVIGTPEYMSPEQAGLGGLDIDARTDVYSLGMLLYELITGCLPFNREDVTSVGLLELQRRIKELEPPKPSSRMLSMRDNAAALARSRSTTLKGMVKTLRGDLDLVVMKAIERDRTRRYETPMELANDIGRHLRGEAVLAARPGALYTIRKFANRNRTLVTVSAMMALVVSIAGVAVYDQITRAGQATETADNGKKDLQVRDAELARSQAETRAREAELARSQAETKAREAELVRVTGEFEGKVRGAEGEAATARAAEAARQKDLEAVRSELAAVNQQRRAALADKQLWESRHRELVAASSLVQRARFVSDAVQSGRSLLDGPRLDVGPFNTWLDGYRQLAEEAAVISRACSTLRASPPSQAATAAANLPPLGKALDRLEADLEQLGGKDGVYAAIAAVAGDLRRTWTATDDAGVTWQAVAESIRKDAGFAGRDLKPQRGLAPLRRNADSKLWEFLHLPSASAEPVGSEEASAGHSGIVFVLLPGRRADERTRSVELDPFFLAKHEITRSQWDRLTGKAWTYAHNNGSPYNGDTGVIGVHHPAESISWDQAVQYLGKHGLTLPTDMQWEYGCRAGQTSMWCSGDTSAGLANYANLQDVNSGDTHWSIRPVGVGRPNDFGLFDVHGNVQEWTLDEYQALPRPGDGAWGRCYRGGSFLSAPAEARSAQRSGGVPSQRFRDVGVRAARRVE